MMGWQWHQLDHMQIICTSLQTDNHASTSSVKRHIYKTPTNVIIFEFRWKIIPLVHVQSLTKKTCALSSIRHNRNVMTI